MRLGFLVAAMCLAEVLGMAGYSVFPALIPLFLDEWALTNAEVGWITGIFFLGYTVVVPFLVGITDRIDTRRVYLASTALAAAAVLGFALLANGFWTALLFRAIAGIGLAGTYMPGLKALADRAEGAAQARIVTWYTAFFTVGAGLSFVIAGTVTDWLCWRWAFGAAGLATLAGLAITWVVLPASPPEAGRVRAARMPVFGPVSRNRVAMAYILGYGALVWGLSALRSWIVAFLVFSQSLQPAGTAVAAAINMIGVPAGIAGNELGIRFGLRRAVVLIFLAAAVFGAFYGFTAAWPTLAVVGLCFLYFTVIQGNISTLTTGAVAAAEPGRVGATMALHSFVGFACAFAGPLVFGLGLDLTGGNESVLAWGLAIAVGALACVAGAVVVGTMGGPPRA